MCSSLQGVAKAPRASGRQSFGDVHCFTVVPFCDFLCDLWAIKEKLWALSYESIRYTISCREFKSRTFSRERREVSICDFLCDLWAINQQKTKSPSLNECQPGTWNPPSLSTSLKLRRSRKLRRAGLKPGTWNLELGTPKSKSLIYPTMTFLLSF